MAKPLHAGGEVDAWCTKCKLVLNHRIIAMVGQKPVRVECSTCNSHHNFRGHAPGEKPAASGSSASTGTRRVVGGAGGSSRGPTKAVQAALDRERSWEKAVSGHTVAEFKAYRVSGTFAEGELIRHSKFGDGIITAIVDAKKIEVLFKDDTRILAQGLTD
jgi:hypothetical protein